MFGRSRKYLFLSAAITCLALETCVALVIPSSSTTTTTSSATKAISTRKHQDNEIVGIIFDMDGTLTEPCIDFARMRKQIYAIAVEEKRRNLYDQDENIEKGDVLKMVETFSPWGKERAKDVFDEIESQALANMKVMPGAIELCHFLDQRGIKRALLTRNVEKSVQHFYTHHLQPFDLPMFEPAVARDTTTLGQVILPKPHPDAILYICQQWDCHPSQVMMVGDSEKDDMVAANRAKCKHACWLRNQEDNNSGNDEESQQEERKPTLVVNSLADLQRILEKNLVIAE